MTMFVSQADGPSCFGFPPADPIRSIIGKFCEASETYSGLTIAAALGLALHFLLSFGWAALGLGSASSRSMNSVTPDCSAASASRRRAGPPC